MRQRKKLTRAQRILLEKSGYKDDLSTVYYVMENRQYIYFVTTDNVKVMYNKSTSQLETRE